MNKVSDFPQVKQIVMIRHLQPGTPEGRTTPAVCILINHPGFNLAPGTTKRIYVRGFKSQGNEILVDPEGVLPKIDQANKWLKDYCSEWEGYVTFRCEDQEIADMRSPGWDEEPIWMIGKRIFNSYKEWIWDFRDAHGWVFGSSYGGDGIQF